MIIILNSQIFKILMFIYHLFLLIINLTILLFNRLNDLLILLKKSFNIISKRISDYILWFIKILFRIKIIIISK